MASQVGVSSAIGSTINQYFGVGNKHVLTIAPNALHGSKVDEHIPQCQPGTRKTILTRVAAWANNTESETIFWLCGPAGTGKSTISRTVAQEFEDEGRLAASYFFKRGEKGRSDTSLFFATIASRLAKTVPTFKSYLTASLEELGDDKIEDKALKTQFQTLILTPLSKVDPEASGIPAKVIVIDALDECECYENIRSICSLLSQLHGLVTVRLRVFLTSRSIHAIDAAFLELKRKNIECRKLDLLHEEFHEETKTDIAAFLKLRFAYIKAEYRIPKEPWPEHGELGRLISFATTPSPLFIYATTLCRFVDDREGREDPTERLADWLKQCNLNTPQLNQIYLPVLNYVFFGSYNIADKPKPLSDSDLSLLLQILGVIVLAAVPLPAWGIAALLGIREFRVGRSLRNLHAVLNVPDNPCAPVQVLHKSFSDFLLGQDGTGAHGFQVDATETHAMLTSKCIKRMAGGGGLRIDMCYLLPDYGKPRDDIDEATVAKAIPLDLEYASLYWVYHLQQCCHPAIGKDEDKLSPQWIFDLLRDIENFLQEHFLHWLESLSLLGKLSEGIQSIRKLLHIAQELGASCHQLAGFVLDADKFVRSHAPIIEQAPMQTYGSALAFSPTTSKVKNVQWKHRLPFIQDIAGIRSDWGALRQTLEGHGGYVRAVAFSPDGKTLGSASEDKTVRLWDAATGGPLQTLEGHGDWVLAVAFSPDGKTLTSASKDKTIRLWDAATGSHIQTLEGHRDDVEAMAFSPDGKKLASASKDKTVRLWDAATGRHFQTLEGHGGWVTTVAFSPDGKTLASSSKDKTVRLWDAAMGQHLQTLRGHGGWATTVTFSPDGKTLALASKDKTVRLWGTARGRRGRRHQTLKGHGGWVTTVAFSPDGKTLASASEDKTVRLWDAVTGGRLQTLEGHGGWVLAVAFSHDGRTLASASEDKTVRLWDAVTGSHIQTLEELGGPVSAVTFSPDGKTLASVSDGKTVRLWDAATGRHFQTLEGHSGSVWPASFSHDGKTLASVSKDETVQLWDIATGNHLQTFEGHGGWVRAVAFSPDGKTLASASDDKTVRLWDAVTGGRLQTLEGHGDGVWALAFSPDGKTLVSASYDETIGLWDAITGSQRRTLEGHGGPVNAVAFSPDGKTLASASYDMTVRLWDATTGSHLRTLEGHGDLITEVAFSPDGKYLTTNHGSLRLSTPASSGQCSEMDPSDHALYVENEWISLNGVKSLWLPPDYRPKIVALYGNRIVLGHESGGLTFLDVTFA